MRPILSHITAELIIEMMTGSAGGSGGTGGNAGRITSLRDIHIWRNHHPVHCFVLCTILHRQFRALLVIRIAAVHAPVANRPPQQLRAMIAVCGRRVRMLLESMWMEELILITGKPALHDNLESGAFMLQFAMIEDAIE